MLLPRLDTHFFACGPLGFALVACTPTPRADAPVNPSSPTSAHPAPLTPKAAPAAVAPAASVAHEPAPANPTQAAPTARPFPPADFEPPFARSADAGDGKWRPFDGNEPALSYATVVHPHETSRFISLSIVAVDLTRTRLAFLPGVDDVGKQQVPFVPGLVPHAEQAELFAAFNGGFMPRHGRWGMRVEQTTILPPREPGCTVAIAADGEVRIRSWPVLAAHTDLRAIRQTPPCLLEQGQINAELLSGRDRAWAGQTPGIVTRRRSAVALAKDGRTLFYAIGVEASPKLLAVGLLAAGAHDAAQLDINWNWTRFLLFEHGSDGKPEVSKTLAPIEHTRRDYVAIPSKRDFFYLLRRERTRGP